MTVRLPLRFRFAALLSAAGLLALPAAAPNTTHDCATPSTPAPAQRAPEEKHPTILDLDTDGPHRAYFQLREADAPPGPVPAIGWWKTKMPKNPDIATEPHQLLVANNDPDDDHLRPNPAFQGEVIGDVWKLGVRIARSLLTDDHQETIHMVLEVDGATVIDGAFPVDAFVGRFDPCHMLEYGWYYAVFVDVDQALEAAGVEMGPGIKHRVYFSWKPTGDGNGADTDVYAIDTQIAATSLEFNGGSTPGPRHSLAP